MAWYRTGGGGLPSSLVTDMNAVLNKKMGTSTVYPSSEWADTVNLMGKLPEKTVGGAVVRFDDGADEVPLKSLVANIASSLDGVDEVTVTRTGKNLVDNTNFTYGLPATAIGSSINTISTSTRYAYWGTSIPKGTITFTTHTEDASKLKSFLIYGYKEGILASYTVINTVDAVRTIDFSDCDYMRVAIGSESQYITVQTDISDIGTIMATVGTTSESYEPYTPPEVITVDLGRTIYGGIADVITGEGEDENGNSFSFEPVTVNSLLGTNTIWNNLGNTTVTYRRDIELALSSGAPLMMMASRPPIQEQPQEEEESTDESI